jgi:hypothetical protein
MNSSFSFSLVLFGPGCLLVALWWRLGILERSHRGILLFQLVSLWFLGLVFSSYAGFFVLALPQAIPVPSIYFVIAVAIALGLNRLKAPRIPIKNSEGDRCECLGLFSCGLLFGLLLTCFYISSCVQPVGFWDAWAIWNQRAKFLFFYPQSPEHIFAPSALVYHLDYPLFLPVLVSQAWNSVGAVVSEVPAVISFFFASALSLMLYGSITALRGRGAGLCCVLLAVGHPLFIEQSGFQVADIPLALCFVGAVTSFLLGQSGRGRSNYYLSGLFCGAAPWIKNEGMLFLVLFIFAATVSIVFRRIQLSRQEVVDWLLGIVPGVFAIAVFKLFFAPRSDISDNLRLDGQLATYVVRAKEIIEMGVSLYTGGGGWIALASLIFFVAVLLSRIKNWGQVALPLMLIAGIHFGYFLVYLTSQQDITWYLSTSANRLFIQLWPLLIAVITIGIVREGSWGNSRGLEDR